MTGPTTEVILIRHGETDWNAEGRIQGHLDIPLNETGLAQADALAHRLSGERLGAIYSSDLGRAWVTAAGVAERLNIAVLREPRLRERHLGVLQGLTRDEASARHPAAWDTFRMRKVEESLEGGESLSVFVQRIHQVLGEVKDRHAGTRVLLMTHGGALDVAYRLATDMPLAAARNFPILNTSINVLQNAGGRWRIDRWGDVTHLEPDASRSIGADFVGR